MKPVRQVAVLGAGTMGAGIAAHLANCGIRVLLLDRVPEGGGDRDALARKAKALLTKTSPPPLYLPEYAALIEPGNFEDDLPRIVHCDWVVEAVTEDPRVKAALFARVAEHHSPGTVVSTNTSGIPIALLAKDLPGEMARYFLGTHFFNPPRYLNLLEIIPAPSTLPEVVSGMKCFAETVLGKGVVMAKDTPDFVANRLLTFVMQWVLHHVRECGLTVEDVDALTGPAIGHAKSATFRTADLVGLDVLRLVVGNVYRGCPHDERHDLMKGPGWFDALANKGWLGDKTGSGFYRKTSARDAQGRRVIETLDLDRLEYRPPRQPRFACIAEAKAVDDLAEQLRVMHFHDDHGAHFVFRCFANLAQYAGERLPEIADDIVNIDRALRWGFGWETGVFETWDLLGFEEVCRRMAAEGIALPPIARKLQEKGANAFYKTAAGVRQYFDAEAGTYKDIPVHPHALRLNVLASDPTRVVRESAGARLLDVGDGILCAEFRTKMNTIDGDIMAALNEGLDLLEAHQFEGLIVANQGTHFCAGANLELILERIETRDWEGIDELIGAAQGVNMRMKYSRRPVVVAPHHFTLGGGMELCLHGARCVASAETYGGLVEAGVGLVPSGGGVKEMLARALGAAPPGVEADPLPYVRRAFENMALAKVSTSGPELVSLGFLRDSDVVERNPDHQVHRAKQVCRALVLAGHEAPRAPRMAALGEPLRAAFRAAVYGMQQSGWASAHDARIAEHLAHILSGGDRLPKTPLAEEDVLDLEREAFLSLCGTEETGARIRHMLATGKPLRN